MTHFTVLRPELHYSYVHVEAETPQEALDAVREGGGVFRSCEKPEDLHCGDCEEFDDCPLLDAEGDEIEYLEYSHTLYEGWSVENDKGDTLLRQ